ncbi:MAG TPA: DUF3237 domain-containing protein [Syntrophorhabdaceae bacterium]|nr:DUF3237 domain-containing protein [Syntrophorhabdaceae bacterium]
MSLQLEYFMKVIVDVATPIEVGRTPEGLLRIIPIVGGTFEGPRIRGSVINGGADWNLQRSDGIRKAWARYTLKTDDEVLISVTNEGFIYTPNLSQANQAPVDPGAYYARTSPRFLVADDKYAWINNSIFVGSLMKGVDDKVHLEFYQVI